MKTMKVLIIGAGFAGATSARIFADAGFHVHVIDKHAHVGGHCHDYKNELGITVHSYGPHIFHTTDKEIWHFVNKFSEFKYYQHRVLSYANGRFIPFPINRDTVCSVFGQNFSTLEIEDFLKRRVQNSIFHEPPENFRDVVVAQIGEELYDLFYKNYTIKQWERDPEELSPEIAKRIPIRSNRDNRYFTDPYQGIPINGYTNLVQNILSHPNISLELNTDFFSFGNTTTYGLIVYTGELDRFFNYKYGELEYRSLKLDLKIFDQEFYQPVATVNYPNDYDWTRITEYKHFLSEKSEKTTVCFEYPARDGEPYYIVMDKKNLDIRASYLEKVNILEKNRGHIFLGRLAEYRYFNMDQVIRQAIAKSTSWIRDIS